MRICKKITIFACGIMLLWVIFTAAAMAGPPLKDNACGACHKDFSTIMPKTHPNVGKGGPCLSCHAPDKAKDEPTKFSAEVHKIHQGGKTKQECSACHAL
jgi:hypothetical protein